ncbi:MAG: hypothetical protein Q9202_001902 [Teloschistes flavicans]
MLTAEASTATPGAHMPATEQMVKVMRKPTPDAEYTWVSKLEESFRQRGLETMLHDRIQFDTISRFFLCQSHLMTYSEFCDKLEDSGKLSEAQSGRETIKTLRGEMHQGICAVHDLVIVIGRK